MIGWFSTAVIGALRSSLILSASSVERADVMLCDVESASFFASPLAFCVSLILSLRNLFDASSATVRAPFVGTGGRTYRSLRTMRFLMHLVSKVRLKFLKHGCPRSKNTTTGELCDSGPLREQQDTETARIEMHQSQLLKTNQSQRSSVLYKFTYNQSTLSPDED
ncbi:hypothetical protein ACROYT_G037098 [Oculina patagonica]